MSSPKSFPTKNPGTYQNDPQHTPPNKQFMIWSSLHLGNWECLGVCWGSLGLIVWDRFLGLPFFGPLTVETTHRFRSWCRGRPWGVEGCLTCEVWANIYSMPHIYNLEPTWLTCIIMYMYSSLYCIHIYIFSQAVASWLICKLILKCWKFTLIFYVLWEDYIKAYPSIDSEKRLQITSQNIIGGLIRGNLYEKRRFAVSGIHRTQHHRLLVVQPWADSM